MDSGIDRNMASKKRSKGTNSFSLSEHFGKIILACIAAGSFAIAFGSEKISQWFSPLSTNSTCLNQFYREVPPALNKESLKKTAIRCALTVLMSFILAFLKHHYGQPSI